MNIRTVAISILFFLLSFYLHAQTGTGKKFTKADTLRGSITPERAWWNLLHYSLHIIPDIAQKTLQGSVDVQFRAVKAGRYMQIDLQQPLIIDSVTTPLSAKKNKLLSFKRDSNVAIIDYGKTLITGRQSTIRIYYHGTPREAIRPPWDGGVSWKTDATGAPFVATSCQGLGASAWWPCKDHQADEPDSGMLIAVRVPDTLTEVSNGRLKQVIQHGDRTKTWVWEVKSPINNYGVSMNIGKYTLLKDQFRGESGLLSLDYYVLQSNKDSATQQLRQVKPMLRCFEYWFGPYPFYQDGYKLVEVPYLGMEHQSNVAYGNKYQNGYLGKDLSGTGWGLKWDFIIIHESGHEWFGNNITSKDIADMWIHEGFTNYSETLFTEWTDGKQAGNAYNFGSRKNIRNDKPIIAPYNVQATGSGDMYYKASSMIHSIRLAMNNDAKFREMLRSMNRKYRHSMVTTKELEQFMSGYTGFSVTGIFDQYLRGIQIPVLEYYISYEKDKLVYRWSDAVEGFNLPLQIPSTGDTIRIRPKLSQWQEYPLKRGQAEALQLKDLSKYFYIQTLEKKEMVIKLN
ncbi:MAG: M1 family metallopeptidase [Sphingobacteriia bacterium]|nr:M1 family metallopeptidase [Sphingobacteriia bacterium]